jgi:hypothetical protein
VVGFGSWGNNGSYEAGVPDIHGNPIALDAVIADAATVDVDAWWVLGDLVAIGPAPCRTLETLVALPNVEFLSGNTDDTSSLATDRFPIVLTLSNDPNSLTFSLPSQDRLRGREARSPPVVGSPGWSVCPLSSGSDLPTEHGCWEFTRRQLQTMTLALHRTVATWS